MDKISIIVPVYNEEKRIKKCIDSLINQTYSNIEILIINDGSTDNTLKVLDEYKDEKVKIITIENRGQGGARNVGIKKAQGKYLMFVDSDDYVDKSIVKKLYDNLIINKSDISICNIIKKYSNREEEFKNYFNLTDDKIANYIVSHTGPVARLYKRDLFVKNNIYFLEKCIYEDLATIPLLGIYAKKISYIDEYLYYYVIRENSSMNQVKYSKKLEDIFIVMEHLSNNFDTSNKYYNEILEYLYIEHLLYSANIRFLNFKEGIVSVKKISKLMKNKYPNWKKNKYYKRKSFKFKLFCILSSKNLVTLCKLIKKLGGK